MKPFTFGSLFSGIGGLDLGLERAGMNCRWQVEIDPFALQVLQQHWPDVPRHDDVRTWPTPATESVDMICGGFPCEDISTLNYLGKGIDGEKSGLWKEFARTIRTLRPKFVLIENVPALVTRGLHKVLGQLAAMRYDAEWQIVPASAFGAPHRRDRLFIVAYSDRKQFKTDRIFTSGPQKRTGEEQAGGEWDWSGRRVSGPGMPTRIRHAPHGEFLRVADGIADRVDRYRVIGKCVSPQVGEWIGRQILRAVDPIAVSDEGTR